jgi:hypothetical protein
VSIPRVGFPGSHRTGITELRDAPEFSNDSWEDRDWETRTHQHYPDAQLLEMEGATDEPATINLLSVFSQLWRTVSQRREMNHLQQKPILAKGKRL